MNWPERLSVIELPVSVLVKRVMKFPLTMTFVTLPTWSKKTIALPFARRSSRRRGNAQLPSKTNEAGASRDFSGRRALAEVAGTRLRKRNRSTGGWYGSAGDYASPNPLRAKLDLEEHLLHSHSQGRRSSERSARGSFARAVVLELAFFQEFGRSC